MNAAPVFIGGLDRSGKTYLSMMLSAHPRIIVARRANLWTRHYRRYGRLDRPRNLERCLSALAASKHIRSLDVDFDRLRREFTAGEPAYARLFALILNQYAARSSKARWGDQTEGLEKIAPVLMAEYPRARFLHLIRDPRDRYQAILEKNRLDRGAGQAWLRGNSLGAASARWLSSASLGVENQRRYPDRYRVVTYETLMTRPVETLRGICEFIGEDFHAEMIEMRAERRFAGRAERVDGLSTPLSTEYIGRYRQGLSPFEIGFIQQRSRRWMQIFGYQTEPIRPDWMGAGLDWLFSSASLLTWQMVERSLR